MSTLHQEICNSCGAEYMLGFDEDEILDDPAYCAFCGAELDEYEDEHDLEFDEDLDE